MEVRVNNRFRIGAKIGHGSTGSVHRGKDLTTNEDVAIKLEYLRGRHSPHLDLEARCYEALAGEQGIPRLRWFGRENEYNVMVIDLLGSNLEDLYLDLDRKFTLQTILKLAGQMISRIETLHNHGYVHCDIKPSNFAVGRGDQKHCIFLIDFGLTKRYINPVTNEPYPMERCAYAGTDRYSSINTHLGFSPGPRDDLESLGYSILYFFKGFLPWQSLAAKNSKQKRTRIFQKKNSTPIEELCKGLPMMVNYLNYCRQLKYTEQPDYDYLRHLFWDIFERKKYKFENDWDWDQEPKPEEQNASQQFDWASSSWRRATPRHQDDGSAYLRKVDSQLSETIKKALQRDFLQRLRLTSKDGSDYGNDNNDDNNDVPKLVPLTPEAVDLL